MIADRLIDALYADALVLSDEARACFDGAPDVAMAPRDRIALASESLKVTTRLMNLITWTLDRKVGHDARLAAPIASDAAVIARLPKDVGAIVTASVDLYARASHIATGAGTDGDGPVRALHERLSQAF